MEYILFTKERIDKVINEYKKYYEYVKLKDSNKFYINPDLKPIVYKEKSDDSSPRQTVAEMVIFNAYQEISLYIKDESRLLLLLTSFSLAISALLEEIDINRGKKLSELPEYKEKVDELISDISSEFYGSCYTIPSDKAFLKKESSKNVIAEIYDIEKVPSYSQKVLRCINFVFIKLLVFCILNRFVGKVDLFLKFFKIVYKNVIKKDTIIQNLYLEGIGKPIELVDVKDLITVTSFLYERDLVFWVDALNIFNNDHKKKGLYNSCDNVCSLIDIVEIKNILYSDGFVGKAKYATFRLKPIRNICSHIGMADLPAEWFIYTLDIVIRFADSIGREDVSALLMKLQLFTRYDVFGFDEYARDEYKTFTRPQSFLELDYRFLFFRNNTIQSWKEVCKIKKEKMDDSYKDFSDVFSIIPYYFVESKNKEFAIKSIIKEYSKKKILYSEWIFSQKYKDNLYKTYPFHPSFFQSLYAMGLSNSAIIEICDKTIKSVLADENNQKSMIMLSDIDLTHPEIAKYLKEYFYLPSICNPSLGWYYLRNNFFSSKSPSLLKFAEYIKVDPLLVNQITKSILINTISKNTFFYGSMSDERYKKYYTYCKTQGLDMSIRDVCIDPKIDNKNLKYIERTLSNIDFLMGFFLTSSKKEKWLLKNYNDYLFDLSLYKYKSQISNSDIEKVLDEIIPGLSVSEKNELMMDANGVLNGLRYLDKIDSFHSAFRVLKFGKAIRDMESTI